MSSQKDARAETVRLFRALRQNGIYAKTNLSCAKVYERMLAVCPPKTFGRWIGYAWCALDSDFLMARTNSNNVVGMKISYDGSLQTREKISATAKSLGMRVLLCDCSHVLKIKMFPKKNGGENVKE